MYRGIWLYCGCVSEAHWPGLDWQQDDRAQQARLQLEAGMITWKHTATETQTQKEGEGVLIPEHGGFKVQHCSVRTAVLLRWVKGYWGSLLWYVLWRQTGSTQWRRMVLKNVYRCNRQTGFKLLLKGDIHALFKHFPGYWIKMSRLSELLLLGSFTRIEGLRTEDVVSVVIVSPLRQCDWNFRL